MKGLTRRLGLASVLLPLQTEAVQVRCLQGLPLNSQMGVNVGCQLLTSLSLYGCVCPVVPRDNEHIV